MLFVKVHFGMDDKVWVVTSIPEVLKLMDSMPVELKTMQFLIVLLIVVDTVTGLVKAIINKELSSHRMRIRSLSKGACFFSFLIMGLIASILIKSWVVYAMAYTLIMTIEVSSIFENMVVINKAGAIRSQAIEKFLSIIGIVFEVVREKPSMISLTTTTTIDPLHPEAPAISVNSIEKIRKNTNDKERNGKPTPSNVSVVTSQPSESGIDNK